MCLPRVMPPELQAFLWGLLGGSALLAGAAIPYLTTVPQRVVAAIMAFGSGVLISALSFELMDEALRQGGFAATALGFIGGAAVYTAANIVVSRRGGKHRKRSGEQQKEDSGTAIAIGSLLDGIPESVVIGAGLVGGGEIGLVTVAAVFLSNIPEGMSSSYGMKRCGRSAAFIFGLWGGVTMVAGLSSWAGYAVIGHFGPPTVAATQAVAAGAILAMISDTMIPEAFEVAHEFAGLITVAGFLAAFTLSKLL